MDDRHFRVTKPQFEYLKDDGLEKPQSRSTTSPGNKQGADGPVFQDSVQEICRTSGSIIMAAYLLHKMCKRASEMCQEHPNGCPTQADGNE